ncbi:hypothetical protein SAMN05216428_102441 [Nitrosospira sp. Nsp11]|uniref:hypothetical protein n=1 Tax=Nitrosospira sp. Nsp11 TaxID=1855338 RepID=UPI000916257E|nr:hypothetical protein [Nitrosospira sp. Nsp11]SHL44991.1 hypothetical protein SAMN05216428_102441 [Nitrosospira sp. Nsp11]
MHISLRQLYAAGEPIGDSATERLPCGRIIYGGGGSKSSSTVSSSASSQDKRMALTGGVGINAEDSVINVESVDKDMMVRALDSVDLATATGGEGLDKLLNVAVGLFEGAGALVDKTQSTALAQLDTLNRAANDSRGAIDQKTMIALAIAGAAIVIIPKMVKK